MPDRPLCAPGPVVGLPAFSLHDLTPKRARIGTIVGRARSFLKCLERLVAETGASP